MHSLWPHQRLALDELNAAIADGERNICITSPTGGGKSLILFTHMTQGRYPSIVYTDRKLLMSQLARDMDNHGIQYGIRAAGYEPRLLDDVQLAMVQTEASKTLKGDRDIHPASIVYIDEAHKNSGETVQSLAALHQEAVPEVIRIGFTATPLDIGHFYDHLIVAGTNTELMKCGALVPAYHFGPDEPDTKWIGKITVDSGECGLPNAKRMEFAHRVFGSVVEHYEALNPNQDPTILFAPGVKESIWFAEELNYNGISAAHIDGTSCWMNGELHKKDQDLCDEIAERHKSGDIKVVCNRFVLREGINWPWVKHGIFATVFGSLTSYIQAGGRYLRAFEGKNGCTIQDHGGNWHRHGSLNSDREWDLSSNDRIESGLREMRMRNKVEREPIQCPKCHAVRMGGPKCWNCGFEHITKSRRVLQKDGSLKHMNGDIYRRRRYLTDGEKIRSEWRARVKAIRRSKKPTVMNMTFAQLDATFARDHNWQFAPRDIPGMPVHDSDWFRPIAEVMELRGDYVDAAF